MREKNVYRIEIQFSICLNFWPTFSSAAVAGARLTLVWDVDNLFFRFDIYSICGLFSCLHFQRIVDDEVGMEYLCK